jgi:thermitase
MVEQRARRQRWFVVLIVLALAFVLSGAGMNSASAQAPPEERFLPGEILVKFEPGTRGQTISDVHQRIGGRVEEVIRGIGVQVVGVPEGQEQRLVTLYERNPNVRYAEVNGLYYAFDHQKPNDPRVDDQWQYHNTGQTGGTSGADIYAFEAWHTILGNSSVPIAVLDTGTKATHEDLNNKVTKSKNFAICGDNYGYGGSPCAVDDKQGHGTHVAGSAAANTSNGLGVAGTCRDCSLYNVKVLDDSGSGAYSEIANGIIWAADEGAKVISMSLGGSTDSKAVRDAVNYAWGTKPDGSDSGKRAVIVAAAGNDGTTAKSYPGAYDNVIAVGATDHRDLKADYSNYGDWVDVAAPGSAILSTTIDSAKYGKKSGTSMATPHVAGVAGLVWSAFPGASNQQVREKIAASIEDKTVLAGTGSDWAKARINACKAVGGTCIREDKTAPTVTNVSPTDGATGVSRATNVTATFSEAMDPASLTTETVTLVKDGSTTPISAAVSYDEARKTATLDPSTGLEPSTKYTATVKGGTSGAKDQAGNPLAADKVWSFTAESSSSGDTIAPTVGSVTPANGATGVSRSTTVTATFSEAMDPATLTNSTVTLKNGSTTVSATVSYDAASKKVTLKPSATLSYQTKYTATVKGGTSGAKDQAGNPLAADKVWSFTTGWY